MLPILKKILAFTLTALIIGNISGCTEKKAEVIEFKPQKLVTQTAEGTIKIPEESGKYKLAYHLHNSANEGAYFANDIDRFNGYNILYKFEIE